MDGDAGDVKWDNTVRFFTCIRYHSERHWDHVIYIPWLRNECECFTELCDDRGKAEWQSGARGENNTILLFVNTWTQKKTTD